MSLLWILLTLLPVLGGAERFNCKGRILGAYYADAKSGCKAFHVCVRVAGGGIRDFRFFCPPGTLFHQEAQTCTDWGDDDPLACPADIYDGQFDLYRIGSGFDTKKLTSVGNRDDEAEFGLQRAETGDRRLSQNNVSPNKPDSDLRAAHSSDFFSGQRDRGRDEPASPAPAASSPSTQQAYQRQSFRRPTTQRTYPTPPPSQYTTPSQPPTYQPQPQNSPGYDVGSKRKLVRKRPIYVSTKAPSTFPPSSPAPQSFNAEAPQQNYNNRRLPQQNRQQQSQFQQPQQQQQQKSQFQQPQQQQQQQSQFQQPQQQQQQKSQFQQPQQQQQQQSQFQQPQQQQQYQQPQQQTPKQQQSFSTPNLPPQYKQYKDEYVEVSRVTPKQNPNKFFPNSPPSTPFAQSTATPRYNKTDGLVELYNYDAQSTPGLNAQNENNRPFKVRNNFNVQDVPREPDFQRAKNINFNNVNPTTINDYSISAKTFPTSTPANKNNNFNSVSYEPEKKNFVPFAKQNYFNNNAATTGAPVTTIYSTSRPEPPLNLNTVAYNTNIGFNTQSETNYAESDEDDGQYHPPHGEDDGQYRPEIYDRELLSGAHSLNIAASGNRLPEDRKVYSKNQVSSKPVAQTAAPRPFRPAPTPTVPPTSRQPETAYPTTQQSQTQRTFDYVQTYTTTSRPTDYQALRENYSQNNEVSARQTSPTTTAPRAETRPTRPTSRALPPQTPPPTPAPRPSTKLPHFAKPSNNKEDNSYDYAYYDSDPGFSEYDHIEEFGKTKTRA